MLRQQIVRDQPAQALRPIPEDGGGVPTRADGLRLTAGEPHVLLQVEAIRVPERAPHHAIVSGTKRSSTFVDQLAFRISAVSANCHVGLGVVQEQRQTFEAQALQPKLNRAPVKLVQLVYLSQLKRDFVQHVQRVLEGKFFLGLPRQRLLGFDPLGDVVVDADDAERFPVLILEQAERGEDMQPTSIFAPLDDLPLPAPLLPQNAHDLVVFLIRPRRPNHLIGPLADDFFGAPAINLSAAGFQVWMRKSKSVAITASVTLSCRLA